MNYNLIISLLDKITYKPGWSFNARLDLTLDTLVIYINRPTNCINTQKPIKLQFKFYIDNESEISQFEFLDLLYNQIKTFEDHEIREWFKFNDRCHHEPHPELNTINSVLLEFKS